MRPLRGSSILGICQLDSGSHRTASFERSVNDSARPQCYEFGRFRLHRRLRVIVDADGTPVRLTPKAFDALLYFVEHPGVIIERTELLNALWPNTIVEENNLTQGVAALRRALGDALIVTVPRRGYQFVAEVRAVREAADGTPQTESAERSARNAGKFSGQRLFQAVTVVLVIAVCYIAADIYVFERGGTVDRPAPGGAAATAASNAAAEPASVTPPAEPQAAEPQAAEPEGAEPPTATPQAYALFQQAKAAINEQNYASDAAITLLDRAVAADPDFALAYLYRGIGRLLRARNAMNRMLTGYAPGATVGAAAQELELARGDAAHALRLDPGLGYAHALDGGVARVEGDLDAAQRGFDRALELSPDDAYVLSFVAAFYLRDGRRDEAVELLGRVEQLDRTDFDLAELLFMAGERAAASHILQDLIEVDPAVPQFHLYLGYVAAIEGNARFAESELHLAEELLSGADFGATPVLKTLPALVYAYGRIGRTADAQRVFAKLERYLPKTRPTVSLAWVEAYLGLGDTDRAYEWATVMAADPLPPFLSPQLHFVLNTYDDPRLRAPRFLALRRKLGHL